MNDTASKKKKVSLSGNTQEVFMEFSKKKKNGNERISGTEITPLNIQNQEGGIIKRLHYRFWTFRMVLMGHSRFA